MFLQGHILSIARDALIQYFVFRPWSCKILNSGMPSANWNTPIISAFREKTVSDEGLISRPFHEF
jgi:hypothetical protein